MGRRSRFRVVGGVLAWRIPLASGVLMAIAGVGGDWLAVLGLGALVATAAVLLLIALVALA